jgi:hypothetical protein
MAALGVALVAAYALVLVVPWTRDFFHVGAPAVLPAAVAAGGGALGVAVAAVALHAAQRGAG